MRRNLCSFLFVFFIGTICSIPLGVTDESPAPVAAPSKDQVVDRSGPWLNAEKSGYDPDYEKSAQTLKHRISSVIVYSDRAKVFRDASAHLAGGFNWVAFRDLPASFDKSSLRIKTTMGKIAQVVVADSFRHVSLPATIQVNVNELRKLYGTLLDQLHLESSLRHQYNFVQNLRLEAPFSRQPAGKEYKSFSASPQALNSALDEIRAKSKELTGELIKIQEQIHQTKEQIEYRENKIQLITSASDQKQQTEIYVLIQNERAGDGSVEINYMIHNALWKPVYDIRADLAGQDASATVELVTAAMVEQHTGEDWNNVQLTVSTLDPVPLFLPQMKKWALGETREAMPEPKIAQLATAGKGGAYNTKGLRQAAKQKIFARDAEFQSQPQAQAKAAVAAAVSAPAVMDVLSVNKPVVLAKEARSSLKKTSAARAENARLQNGAVAGASYYGSAGAASNEIAADEGANAEDDKAEEGPDAVAGDYNLRRLEDFFPKLNDGTDKIAAVNSEKEETTAFEVTSRSGTPAQNSYQDSSLPAVVAHGRDIELTSPFRVSIKSDDAPQKIPMTSQVLSAALFYFAVPKMDQKVYLRAKTINTTRTPILGGPAQIFMNGDLVTKTELPSISEGGTLSFDLGSDINIEAKRIVDSKSSETGIFKKSHRNDVGVKLEIVNHHAFPVKVELKDNYPLSPTGEIVVDLKTRRPSSEKTEDGLLFWKLNIPAHAKQTVSFDYSVTYPENYIISEDN